MRRREGLHRLLNVTLNRRRSPRVPLPGPTQLPESFQKCRMARLSTRRVCAYPFQKTNDANLLALLRARDERPCNHRTANNCDEIAPSHCPPQT